MKDFIKEVRDYYPHYLEAHKHPGNKALHFVGNLFLIVSTVGLFKLFLFTNLFLGFGWIPLVLILPAHLVCTIYLFAWPGHLLLEKNKPATWTTSRWITKSCDWVMMKDLMSGKLKWDTRNK